MSPDLKQVPGMIALAEYPQGELVFENNGSRLYLEKWAAENASE